MIAQNAVPANQNIYIGCKRGGRRVANPIRYLPIVRGIASMEAADKAQCSVERVPKQYEHGWDFSWLLMN